jgi:hypothetical protein
MTKVSQWLRHAQEPHPLEQKCDFGTYKGWHWKTILEKDPDWVLNLVTQGRVLLPGELEEALTRALGDLTWDAESLY